MHRTHGLWALALLSVAGCSAVIGDPSGSGEGSAREGAGGPLPPAGPRACEDEPALVAPSPLRRLTREEWANSVRDVLGVDGDAADSFPPDETVGPFHVNVHSAITEAHVEHYMRAAEEVAVAALRAGTVPGCAPSDGGCARSFVRRFGERLWRRPLDDEETAALVALVEAEPSFDDGVAASLAAMLEAPWFLYLVEEGAGGGEPGAPVPVTPFELASRLSYFLWRSAPDEALLAAAAAGELATTDEIEAQARRMLDDPRAHEVVHDFHLQWLGLSGTEDGPGIEEVVKDPDVYPELDDAMRAALLDETNAFVDAVYFGGGERSLSALLTAPYTYVDPTAARLYGVPHPGSGTVRVDLDPTERAGLLTQASVLAVYGKAAQSAPVQRGVLVRERFLCQELPSPPPGIMVDDPAPDPSVPRREQFERHRTDPSCAACHGLIDPIGFGFEHYDGIGRWRDEDGGRAVDATGELTSTDVDGSYEGAVELAHRLAESEQVRACVVTQWMRYATERPESASETCAARPILDRFAASGGDLHELLVDIAASELFRSRPSE